MPGHDRFLCSHELAGRVSLPSSTLHLTLWLISHLLITFPAFDLKTESRRSLGRLVYTCGRDQTELKPYNQEQIGWHRCFCSVWPNTAHYCYSKEGGLLILFESCLHNWRPNVHSCVLHQSPVSLAGCVSWFLCPVFCLLALTVTCLPVFKQTGCNYGSVGGAVVHWLECEGYDPWPLQLTGYWTTICSRCCAISVWMVANDEQVVLCRVVLATSVWIGVNGDVVCSHSSCSLRHFTLDSEVHYLTFFMSLMTCTQETCFLPKWAVLNFYFWPWCKFVSWWATILILLSVWYLLGWKATILTSLLPRESKRDTTNRT